MEKLEMNEQLLKYTLDHSQAELLQVRYYLHKLAPWWLKEEVYTKQKISYSRPRLKTGRGECPILLVRSANMLDNSILRKAMIYPVCWEKRADHDKRIPQQLQILADKIVGQLTQEISDPQNRRTLEMFSLDSSESHNLNEWHLVPGQNDFPDLNRINIFSFDSAWASLTASLLVAVSNEESDPTVFGSGAWNFEGNRCMPIEGTIDKIEVASEWGGKYIVVPPDPENDTNHKSGIKTVSLPGGRKTMLDTIEEYYHLLKKEPSDNATFKQCENYYLQMPSSRHFQDFQDFYLRRLKGFVVQQTKEILTQKGEPTQFDTLVSWVSNGSEMIEVATETFTPKTVVLLYTSQFKNELNKIKGHIENNTHTKVVSYLHEGGNSREELQHTLSRAFSEMDDNQRILVDLTLGTVIMSIVLYDNAKPGTTFLYWIKEQGRNNRVIPTKTKPELWIKELNAGTKK